MLRIAPLFPLAAGLISGILLDRAHAPAPASYLSLLILVSLFSVFRCMRDRAAAAMVFLMALGAGGLHHWSHARRLSSSSIERFATPRGAFVRLRGTIATEPELLDPPPNVFAEWMPQRQRTVFALNVEEIQSGNRFATARGCVRVTVYEPVLDLRPQDRYELFGRLLHLTPAANPGAFDWRTYSRAQGIVARLICQHRESVRPLDAGRVRRANALAWVRKVTSSLLIGDLPSNEDEASLLDSMLLGRRSRLSERLNEIFIRSGCIHFISVSGVHMVIVMWFARFASRIMGASRNTTTWAMALAIVIYTLLGEPRPPIVRAAIIGLIYCAARLIGRERAYLNWTSAAAIVLLLTNPHVVFDVGFQLSFSAVLGVAYLAPALRGIARSAVELFRRRFEREQDGDSNRRIRQRLIALGRQRAGVAAQAGWWLGRRLGEGLAVGLAAWLSGLPIVAAHFYRVQPWAAVNSVLLMPFVSVTMITGFVKMAVAAISPTAGELLGRVLTWWDVLLIGAVDAMASLPGAQLDMPPMPLWLAGAFYCTLVLASLRFSPDVAGGDSVAAVSILRTPVLRLPRYAARASFAGLLLSGAVVFLPVQEPKSLRITALSVGRGSATVIELPDGKVVLYDAGSSYSADCAPSTIVPFLRSRGIHSIDRVFVSHANLDHFSGLPTLLDEIQTGTIVLNDYFERRSGPHSPSWFLLDQLKKNRRKIEPCGEPRAWTYGGAQFQLLWPGRLSNAYSANDTSTVLRITHQGRSVLLTGDIDEAAQAELLKKGDLAADVLFLPHHGSVRSTTRQFVTAVGAEVWIRSSDEPMDETINGLVELRDLLGPDGGKPVLYNTADCGAITVTIDAAGIAAEVVKDECTAK